MNELLHERQVVAMELAAPQYATTATTQYATTSTTQSYKFGRMCSGCMLGIPPS